MGELEAEVLVLHGSPGAGKSTLARAVSEALRAADVAHAVVDLDELSLIHPSPGRSFAIDNLRAVWPNYVAAAPGLRLVIPAVLADAAEKEQLREALPGGVLKVCELTAPVGVLKERVTEREPNEFWRERLRGFVDWYAGRGDLGQLSDFEVGTHGRSEAEAADEIIAKAGWR